MKSFITSYLAGDYFQALPNIIAQYEILSSATVSNIDFDENDFCVTQDWSNDAENPALITEIH